jgi:hypothetical protein
LATDVLVCNTFYRYSAFQNTGSYNRHEGVAFFTSKEPGPRRVVNYPKQNYENGVAMNKRTGDWYKHTVRIFKNARNYLSDRKLIKPGLAPSYFIESLLYNWLSEANFEKFVCRNELVWLFGDSPEQWSIDDAQAFRDGMIELWNSW